MTRVIIVILLSLLPTLPSYVWAADNLTCIGPYGEIAGIGGQATGGFNGYQTVTFCLPKSQRLKSSQVLYGLKCQVELNGQPGKNDHHYFHCPLNSSCGVGVFSKADRHASADTANVDELCITYTSNVLDPGTAHLGVLLKPLSP